MLKTENFEENVSVSKYLWSSLKIEKMFSGRRMCNKKEKKRGKIEGKCVFWHIIFSITQALIRWHWQLRKDWEWPRRRRWHVRSENSNWYLLQHKAPDTNSPSFHFFFFPVRVVDTWMSCQAERYMCVWRRFSFVIFFLGYSFLGILYYFINLEYFSFFKRHWLLVFNGRMKWNK